MKNPVGSQTILDGRNIRGTSFDMDGKYSTSSYRYDIRPKHRSTHYGFRVVRNR
jgi:hypothetical protein